MRFLRLLALFALCVLGSLLRSAETRAEDLGFRHPQRGLSPALTHRLRERVDTGHHLPLDRLHQAVNRSALVDTALHLHDLHVIEAVRLICSHAGAHSDAEEHHRACLPLIQDAARLLGADLDTHTLQGRIAELLRQGVLEEHRLQLPSDDNPTSVEGILHYHVSDALQQLMLAEAQQAAIEQRRADLATAIDWQTTQINEVLSETAALSADWNITPQMIRKALTGQIRTPTSPTHTPPAETASTEHSIGPGEVKPERGLQLIDFVEEYIAHAPTRERAARILSVISTLDPGETSGEEGITRIAETVHMSRGRVLAILRTLRGDGVIDSRGGRIELAGHAAQIAREEWLAEQRDPAETLSTVHVAPHAADALRDLAANQAGFPSEAGEGNAARWLLAIDTAPPVRRFVRQPLEISEELVEQDPIRAEDGRVLGYHLSLTQRARDLLDRFNTLQSSESPQQRVYAETQHWLLMLPQIGVTLEERSELIGPIVHILAAVATSSPALHTFEGLQQMTGDLEGHFEDAYSLLVEKRGQITWEHKHRGIFYRGHGNRLRVGNLHFDRTIKALLEAAALVEGDPNQQVLSPIESAENPHLFAVAVQEALNRQARLPKRQLPETADENLSIGDSDGERPLQVKLNGSRIPERPVGEISELAQRIANFALTPIAKRPQLDIAGVWLADQLGPGLWVDGQFHVDSSAWLAQVLEEAWATYEGKRMPLHAAVTYLSRFLPEMDLLVHADVEQLTQQADATWQRLAKLPDDASESGPLWNTLDQLQGAIDRQLRDFDRTRGQQQTLTLGLGMRLALLDRRDADYDRVVNLLTHAASEDEVHQLLENLRPGFFDYSEADNRLRLRAAGIPFFVSLLNNGRIEDSDVAAKVIQRWAWGEVLEQRAQQLRATHHPNFPELDGLSTHHWNALTFLHLTAPARSTGDSLMAAIGPQAADTLELLVARQLATVYSVGGRHMVALTDRGQDILDYVERHPLPETQQHVVLDQGLQALAEESRSIQSGTDSFALRSKQPAELRTAAHWSPAAQRVAWSLARLLVGAFGGSYADADEFLAMLRQRAVYFADLMCSPVVDQLHFRLGMTLWHLAKGGLTLSALQAIADLIATRRGLTLPEGLVNRLHEQAKRARRRRNPKGLARSKNFFKEVFYPAFADHSEQETARQVTLARDFSATSARDDNAAVARMTEALVQGLLRTRTYQAEHRTTGKLLQLSAYESTLVTWVTNELTSRHAGFADLMYGNKPSSRTTWLRSMMELLWRLHKSLSNSDLNERLGFADRAAVAFQAIAETLAARWGYSLPENLISTIREAVDNNDQQRATIDAFLAN